jgi:hypothetical protein
MTDFKTLEERVHDLAKKGKLEELRALLEEHPEVDVDGASERHGLVYIFGREANGYHMSGHRGYYDGWRALNHACLEQHAECIQLLIDYGADVNKQNEAGYSVLHLATTGGLGRSHGTATGSLSCVELLIHASADVNCRSFNGWTPLMGSSRNSHVVLAQLLLEHKADVHCRMTQGLGMNEDALYYAMDKSATGRTPGIAFAFLSCDTDAKHVNRDVTIAVRDGHIEEYKHIQAYIDEYHGILMNVLLYHVEVDRRVGSGQNGIYHEPLERLLEYLGLSMSKNQAVNTSIDGDAKRALIPGHLLNAKHWFDKYKSR